MYPNNVPPTSPGGNNWGGPGNLNQIGDLAILNASMGSSSPQAPSPGNALLSCSRGGNGGALAIPSTSAGSNLPLNASVMGVLELQLPIAYLQQYNMGQVEVSFQTMTDSSGSQQGAIMHYSQHSPIFAPGNSFTAPGPNPPSIPTGIMGQEQISFSSASSSGGSQQGANASYPQRSPVSVSCSRNFRSPQNPASIPSPRNNTPGLPPIPEDDFPIPQRPEAPFGENLNTSNVSNNSGGLDSMGRPNFNDSPFSGALSQTPPSRGGEGLDSIQRSNFNDSPCSNASNRSGGPNPNSTETTMSDISGLSGAFRPSFNSTFLDEGPLTSTPCRRSPNNGDPESAGISYFNDSPCGNVSNRSDELESAGPPNFNDSPCSNASNRSGGLESMGRSYFNDSPFSTASLQNAPSRDGEGLDSTFSNASKNSGGPNPNSTETTVSDISGPSGVFIPSFSSTFSDGAPINSTRRNSPKNGELESGIAYFNDSQRSNGPNGSGGLESMESTNFNDSPFSTASLQNAPSRDGEGLDSTFSNASKNSGGPNPNSTETTVSDISGPSGVFMPSFNSTFSDRGPINSTPRRNSPTNGELESGIAYFNDSQRSNGPNGSGGLESMESTNFNDSPFSPASFQNAPSRGGEGLDSIQSSNLDSPFSNASNNSGGPNPNSTETTVSDISGPSGVFMPSFNSTFSDRGPINSTTCQRSPNTGDPESVGISYFNDSQSSNAPNGSGGLESMESTNFNDSPFSPTSFQNAPSRGGEGLDSIQRSNLDSPFSNASNRSGGPNPNSTEATVSDISGPSGVFMPSFNSTFSDRGPINSTPCQRSPNGGGLESMGRPNFNDSSSCSASSQNAQSVDGAEGLDSIQRSNLDSPFSNASNRSGGPNPNSTEATVSDISGPSGVFMPSFNSTFSDRGPINSTPCQRSPNNGGLESTGRPYFNDSPCGNASNNSGGLNSIQRPNFNDSPFSNGYTRSRGPNPNSTEPTVSDICGLSDVFMPSFNSTFSDGGPVTPTPCQRLPNSIQFSPNRSPAHLMQFSPNQSPGNRQLTSADREMFPQDPGHNFIGNNIFGITPLNQQTSPTQYQGYNENDASRIADNAFLTLPSLQPPPCARSLNQPSTPGSPTGYGNWGIYNQSIQSSPNSPGTQFANATFTPMGGCNQSSLNSSMVSSGSQQPVPPSPFAYQSSPCSGNRSNCFDRSGGGPGTGPGMVLACGGGCSQQSAMACQGGVQSPSRLMATPSRLMKLQMAMLSPGGGLNQLPPPPSTNITAPPNSIPRHLAQRLASIPNPPPCPRFGEYQPFQPVNPFRGPPPVGTLEQRLAAIPVPPACFPVSARPGSIQQLTPVCGIPKTRHSRFQESTSGMDKFYKPVAGEWSDGVGGPKIKGLDENAGMNYGKPKQGLLDGQGGRKPKEIGEDY